jgi:uncharacterized membrane protein YgdD (TMEM256/DUF423 family)
MNTEAKYIQAGNFANMILVGVNDKKQPEWIGTDKQWQMFHAYLEALELDNAYRQNLTPSPFYGKRNR